VTDPRAGPAERAREIPEAFAGFRDLLVREVFRRDPADIELARRRQFARRLKSTFLLDSRNAS